MYNGTEWVTPALQTTAGTVPVNVSLGSIYYDSTNSRLCVNNGKGLWMYAVLTL